MGLRIVLPSDRPGEPPLLQAEQTGLGVNLVFEQRTQALSLKPSTARTLGRLLIALAAEQVDDE